MMFLDDNLLMIARETPLASPRRIRKSLTRMIRCCILNAVERMGDNNSFNIALTNLKRVHCTWNMVAKQLQKEGINFVEIDGFKNYCITDDKLENFAKYL